MILLIGATGNVGSEVARQLSAAGVAFRAMVRNPDKAAAVRAVATEVVIGDLRRPESLDAALAGIDRVFVATSADPTQPSPDHVVDEVRNLLAAAQRAGVRHIVRISALGATPDAPVVLLATHGRADALLAESGIAYTALRPNFFAQAFLGIARASITAQGAFYAPAQRARISYVDVRDIAAVALRALTTPGHENKVYEITGPEALGFDDVARKVSAALGRPVAFVSVPQAGAEQAMLGQGMPPWLAEGFVKLYGFFEQGHGAAVSGAVRDVTGRAPRPFGEALADFAAQA